ncbi:MAG: hypothetical protein EA415_12440 [Sphaerobacteraceae bacterium]|nr:MAG: hypothetical protein EA415_12440 [Sphaerobacteraceae bacterium]
MHRSPIIAGTVATLIIMLIVSTLAIGFSVDVAQAISQSAPLIVASGLAIGLATALLERELA